VSRFQNLMEVLKVLPKTNCRQCREKTCMAFSAAVFKGEKELALCPYVPAEVIEKYGTQKLKTRNIDEDLDNAVNQLKQKIRQSDLAAAAGRTGGRYDGHELTLKVMGKDFSVDAGGNLHTDIHANPWVTAPILNYILCCQGTPLTGRWTSMRELPSGKDWYHFFQHQCEKALKKLADSYPDLFEDLVHLFAEPGPVFVRAHPGLALSRRHGRFIAASSTAGSLPGSPSSMPNPTTPRSPMRSSCAPPS